MNKALSKGETVHNGLAYKIINVLDNHSKVKNVIEPKPIAAVTPPRLGPWTIHRREDYECDAIVCRPRAAREDFLLRPYGKRAVHAVVPYMPNGSAVSDLLTEFELFHILFPLAVIAGKKGWKHFTATFYGGRHPKECSVQISNPSGARQVIGHFKSVVEVDHFLNDEYYCKKGFYIKRPVPVTKKGEENGNA